MARAPVSKTGGWGFESLHSCQARPLRPVVRLARFVDLPKHLASQPDFPRLTV